MKDMIICRDCGENNPQSNRYCNKCGARLDPVPSGTAMHTAEHDTVREFIRRRNLLRLAYLVLAFFHVFPCLPSVLFPERSIYLHIVEFGLIIMAAIWLTRRQWRCPACDSWLGWARRFNPIYCLEPLWCPECKAKLL